MYSLLFLAITSVSLSLLLTPLVRTAAERLGLFDHPDAARKPDYRRIPRVGGIAVAMSFVLSFVFWMLTPLKGGLAIDHALPMIWHLLPAVAVVFTLGLLDDLFNLNSFIKFSGQILAAVLAFFAGIHVVGFGGAAFTQWWWTLPFTILWLVACSNAINLIDGVDGLAAGLSLVAAVCMLLGAAITHNVFLAFATIPLVGCLLGFLRYNFNPASVYLGDSGSLFVGFLLGCYGVLWSQKSATILGMTLPLIALLIPLADTSLAIVRRFLRRQPIFRADRGHIHHRLLDRGLTPRRTVLTLYGAGALAAVFSLFMANNRLEIPVLLVLGVSIWLGIQHLGFVEFGTAGRLMWRGSFRNLLISHIDLNTLEALLAKAETAEDCWCVLEKSYRDFGFYRVEMRLAERTFSGSAAFLLPHLLWRIEIPLNGSDYVELTRDFSDEAGQAVVPAFARVLHVSLTRMYSAKPVTEVRAASAAG